ncbi:hypothetical protein [Pseudoxanthomonas suwonensis]|uniref:Uncharacterized protein n=1 Tax=Pseudoxanthomonas suwonensis TaxID=314722 RepID=A0A0E3UN09_9GAMM|nr:hypothetical protein [Pseudoxanthomonas suwonensis]AKC86786.1 hypothetical protein WQ53_08475 [Pseudoxanthomonas suwonensis]
MLKPGFLVGDFLEAGSMAEAIELAMVELELIDLDEETPEAAENRRKALIAISTGVIRHLKANIEITVAVNRFGAGIPAAATVLSGAAGAVK